MAKYFERVTPESCGVSSEDVIKMIEGMETTPEVGEMHSFMLVRHGKVLAEGSFAPYTLETPHAIFSDSKTFTQLAIAFMIQEGLVTVDDKVADFFPDKKISDYNKKLTIHNLLSMGSGHEAPPPNLGEILGCGDDKVQQFFLSKNIAEPGTFLYENNCSVVLSHIVSRVTGKNIMEYLEPRFLKPLNINIASYMADDEGVCLGWTGVRITPEDLAKLGQFFLNKGKWEGKQLLSEEWCEKAMSKQVECDNPTGPDWMQGYAYQMWRGRYNTARICGAYGQGCVIAPDQDLLFIYNSGTDYDKIQAMMNNFLDNIFFKLSDEPLPENKEGNAKLENKIKSLKLQDIFAPVSARAGELDGKQFSFEKVLCYDSVKVDFADDICKVTLSGDKTISFDAGLTEIKESYVEDGCFIGVDPGDEATLFTSARFDKDDNFIVTARVFQTATILYVEIAPDNGVKLYTIRGKAG